MFIKVKSLSKFIFALLAFSTLLGPDNSFAFGENYDELGFKKNKTYLKFSSEEYVNIFSGNLLLTHTDINLPGNGGFDLKLQRTYNSKLVADFTNIDNPVISGLTLGSLGLGWDMHFGRISDYGLTVINDPNEFFLQMPDGSIHQIYNNNHPNITSHVSSTYITEDFWIIDYDPATDQYTMTLTDGTEYTFTRRVTNGFSYSFLYVTSIKDKNGNEIAIEYYDCCNMINNDPDTGIIGTCPDPTNAATITRHIKKVTDSVGREINFTMLNTMCRGNAISSIDANGNVYNYLYFPGDDRPSTTWLHWDGGSGRLLAAVQPPVGPSWQYFYDVDPNDAEPDGELISVTYPSGGVAQYDYETVVLDLLNSPSATSPVQFRVIASRTTSGPNITSGTWMFDHDPLNLQDITTVIDSCGNKEVYKFFGLRTGSFNGGWSIGLLNNKEVRDSVNLIFQADNNMWTPYQISNDGIDPVASTMGIFLPLLSSETISRDGVNYVTNFSYNTFYDSPTQIAETGEILRTTDITYFEDLTAGNYIIGKPLVTTVTVDNESKTIINAYDISGDLLSEDNFGVLTEFSYHPDGNLEWRRNARGFYTHFDQYSFGVAGRIRLGSSDDLASDPKIIESRTIDWEGTISSFTNGRGHATSYTYDGLNRLTSITPPPSGEAQTTIEYDNLSAQSMIIRKSDSFVQHFLDGFGRPIGTLSTTGVQTEIDYDACGRKVYGSLPFDLVTSNVGESFLYDPLGRMKSVTHPDNTKIDLSYSANSVTVKNERNINTTLNYVSFGDPDEKRLSSVLDADNNTTSYEYDLLGNITRVDSPQGNDRVFTYNSKNFLMSESHPESGTTMFGHDEIGNVTSKTNADGKSIGFEYDRLNRLTLIDHPTGEDDVILDYDDASNRTLLESGSASYFYASQYDQSNRLTRQDVNIGGISYSVDFIYDGKNNLIQSIYPSGEVVDYNYDADGRILHIPPVAGNFSYHPSGAPVHFDNEIGVSSDFTYDNRSRLKTLQVSRTFPYLLVTKEGLGSGTVTSNPLGIDCGSDCALVEGAEGNEVTLTPTPDQDSNFVSWGGDPDCTDGMVTMIGTKVCIATFALKANQETLTVTKDGSGTGTVTSSPPGIDCGSDCTENYDLNTEVTLTANPDANFSFNGWSGDPDCSDGMITMDASKTCNATFGLQQFTLNVVNLSDGFGSGIITSSPVGISCGGDCSGAFDENTQVTLTPMPNPGSQFGSWSGVADCLDGMVTMDSDKSCGATFVKFFTLTIQKNGTGGGNVSSLDGLIDCGGDCSQSYGANSIVSFNITPDPGSIFVGWSGPSGCPTSPTSSALMVTDLACTATFDLLPSNQFSLTITKDGTHGGRVRSDPFGINCGSDCMEVYDEGTSVTLTTNPDSGAVFSGWSGDPDCSDGNVLIDANKTCNATFDISSDEFTLTVDIYGFGKITASNGALPGGIDCRKVGDLGPILGSDCTETHPVNTDLSFTIFTLVPCPPGFLQFCTDPEIVYNSTFIKWEGDPDCFDGEVELDSDKTCIGVFTPYKLNLSTSGGTVSVNPSGIDCGPNFDCSSYYEPGTIVDLTAIPDAGNYFSGWTGDPDCSDSGLIMDEQKSCTASFDVLPTNSFALNVLKSGAGSGTVSSSPAGINCGPDCTEDYNGGTTVNLSATPDPGSIFAGWSGDTGCASMVTMDTDKNCTATFDIETFSLTVIKTGTGSGNLTSSPVGIDCGADCSEDYVGGTNLTITATPDPGSAFDGWSGDCDANGMVMMDAAKNCTASFTGSTQLFPLTVSHSGTGTGTVTSNPSGIDCGIDCTEDYVLNTQVTLIPSPDAGSTFIGWSGDADCSNGMVTMDAGRNCTATFDVQSQAPCDCNDPNAILGTSGDDSITGSNGPDIICGFDGSDTLNGRGGDDCLYGGAGADTIDGGRGSDKLYGGTEDDILVGGRNGDLLDGGPGTDNLDGGRGTDTCVNGETLVNCEISQIQHPLSVSKTGTGSGTVTSNPTGINCGGDCSENYDEWTIVTLAATPNAGSTFDGWSGDCDVNGMVTMDAAKSCSATFTASSQLFTLSLSKSGTGTGIVTSSPSGIDCGIDCTEDYLLNTQVTLTPAPDAGSTFIVWSGDADCSDGMVTMDANKNCSATFDIEFQDPCDCDDPNAILGTSGNDSLTGTQQNDIICGLDGDDTIIGRGGNDCIFGGAGDDTIRGNSGADNLFGGDDNDTIKGGGGNDLLDGGNGTDDLNGGKNTDTCLNGESNTGCEQFSEKQYTESRFHN